MAMLMGRGLDHPVIEPFQAGNLTARRRFAIANVTFSVFLGLVLVAASLFKGLFADSASDQAGDLISQLMYVGLFGVAIFASGMPTKRDLLCVPITFALLLGYCFFSVTWAVAPLISFRRISQTAIVVWLVFRYLDDLGPVRALQIVRWALVALLGINYAMVFLSPYGVHSLTFGEPVELIGNWRGIMPHKNIAGAACGLTILFFVFDNQQFSKLISAGVAAAAAVFLYYTDSRTSEATLVLALALGLAIRPYHSSKRTALFVFLAILAGLAAEILSANFAVVSNYLNDPTALTGRAAIWPLLLEYANDHPWGGAGFGSFWLIGDASPIWTLTSGWVARYAPHGHNGYLDLLVTIGVPGLALAMVALVILPIVRLLLSLEIARPTRSLLLALMTFCLGHNLTESSLLSGAATVQVMLTLAIALIYRECRARSGGYSLWRKRAPELLDRYRSSQSRAGQFRPLPPRSVG